MPPSGTIVINPTELRRGASRFRDLAVESRTYASRLRGLPRPSGTPGGVSGGVDTIASALDTQSSSFADSAVELERRALWAEIADQLMAGYPLTGSQLAEFKAGLRDGTLLRYAEPWQAQLAGEWVGTTYAKTFKNPKQLEELAAILRAGEGSENFDAFAGGFIEKFGAKNLVDVPRVIQAMEYAWPLNGQIDKTDPKIFWDVAHGIHDQPQGNRDWLALLAPFSQALAVATYGGLLSRSTEQAIAKDEDTWAMSQLLFQGKFGKDFLLDCFKSGVVDKIVAESRDARIGAPGEPFPEGHPLNYFDGDGTLLPLDSKVLVLDALARNPDAAVASLTQHLAQLEVYDRFGSQHQVANTMELLYNYGHYEDKGAAFSQAYASAVDHLQSLAHDPTLAESLRLESRATANQLTLDAIDRTINAPNKVDAMTDALAHDLARYHAGNLITIAGENNTVDLVDPKHAGWVDTHHDNRMMLTVRQERDLFAELAKRPDAEKAVLDATAAQQREIVLAGTGGAPTPDNLTWAHNVGAFTGVVMNAHDLHLQDKFDSNNASHRLFFKFLHAGVGLAAGTSPIPGTGAVAGLAIDGLDDATAAKLMNTLNQQGDVNGAMINAVHAQMAAGYYLNDNQHLLPRAPSSICVDPNDPTDRRLKNYVSLAGLDLGDYNHWMREEGRVYGVVSEPSQAVHDAMQDVQSELPLNH
jgi:hypothetical protein